jgi:CBS domain-containing protein
MPIDPHGVEREGDELEVLEGDEGEPQVGRHRDVGRQILETPISDLRRTAPVTVPPDAPVSKAIELMQKRKVSAVVVVERKKARRVAGIFTERDLVSRALPVRNYAKAPVSRFMTPTPETLRPKDSVAYALNKMSVGRFRHVPLVDDAGKPAGIISIRDITDFIVELCPEEILNLPPEPQLAMHPRPDGD